MKIASNNCFHYLYDRQEKAFFYQRCLPIQKHATMILDKVLNKILSIEDKRQ